MKEAISALVFLGSCLVIKGAIKQVGVCDVSNLKAGGVDGSGEVVSPGYPYSAPARERTQPLCRMTLTACPECYMRLSFEEINLPSCPQGQNLVGGCILGCDHLLVYDMNYPRSTSRAIFSRNQGDTFVSISNRVYIAFCHSVSNRDAYKRFRVTFKLMEKYKLITGEHGTSSAVGYFTSPNFPQYYALNREVYFYHLKNTNPTGFIRLAFEDWLLSPNSKMTIYFNNASVPEVALNLKGNSERPYVFSGGPYLYLRFETGEDTIYNHNFVGFKAKYEFVKDEHWPEKQYSVCGEYYYDLYAGQFSFDLTKCIPGVKADCIWVVRKKKNSSPLSYHSHVNLHLQDINLVEGQDTFEVRGGNNSASRLLVSLGSNNLSDTEYAEEEAFYVHLNAMCKEDRKLNIVFTSFSYAQEGKCIYYYHFKCANKRCIFDQLRCDGVDHCGDGSDEINCPSKDATKTPCIHQKSCEDGFGFYCPQELCDRKWDCQDGSDELHCADIVAAKPTEPPTYDFNFHTFIPIAMVTFLLAIAACVTISFCIRVKRSRQIQRNQRGGIASAIRSLMPGERNQNRQNGTRVNINVEIQHYPDSPPSYNEAMRYDAYMGVCNYGYIPTDMSDMLPEPPPYTPTAADPLPIVNPLQGQGDLGWSGSGHPRSRSGPPANPPSYQESVRREQRRGRRHTHGAHGADRRQRRHGDHGEDRPREGRHRQRRHRSNAQNRGPPTISEEIFIDTPPFNIQGDVQEGVRDNRSNGSVNNSGVAPALSVANLPSQFNLTPRSNAQNDVNSSRPDRPHYQGRQGQQNPGHQGQRPRRSHRTRSRSDEGQSHDLSQNEANDRHDQNIEQTASQLVNQIFSLLSDPQRSESNAVTERLESGNGENVTSEVSQNESHSSNTEQSYSEPHRSSNGDSHDRNNSISANSVPKSELSNLNRNVNVNLNGNSNGDTNFETTNGVSTNLPKSSHSGVSAEVSSDIPDVHGVTKDSPRSTGATQNQSVPSAQVHGDSENYRPSFAYDNPVFNLSGIAEDDTSV